MITLERTNNGSLINSVLLDSEMFPRISEDGVNGVILNDKSIYLSVHDDQSLIGVFQLDSANSTSINIHPCILKKYRNKSYKVMNVFYSWVLENLPKNLLKINAEIPTKYKEVYRFAKQVGFSDEGLNRQSIIKGGFIWDQYRLGITRQEMIQFLEVK